MSSGAALVDGVLVDSALVDSALVDSALAGALAVAAAEAVGAASLAVVVVVSGGGGAPYLGAMARQPARFTEAVSATSAAPTTTCRRARQNGQRDSLA